MPRRTDVSSAPEPRDPTDPEAPIDLTPGDPDAIDSVDGAPGPDLSAFPVVGLTRRRAAWIVGVVVAVWVVAVFARQVGDASAASARADAMVASNAARQVEIAALERELERIVQDRYVFQQARAYGLGGPREIPFTLAPDAPPLGDDAPGSAALRVGGSTGVSPLDRWLTLLFGSAD